MSEWHKGILSDIACVFMGQSPSGKTCNTSGEGIPLLNGPTEFGERYPTPVQFTTDGKKICHRNDLLFCVRGSTTGRMNWADQDYALGRGVAGIRHLEEVKLQPFIKGIIDYNLSNLLAGATGSTFPNIAKSQLEQLAIDIPPLEEQKAIAEILSSIDDKIDLLHRQNKTLESLAETLFRQWFVEEASEDWEEKPLDEVAEYLNGLACQKYPPRNDLDRLPVLKIKELRGGFADNFDWAANDVEDKYIVRNGDIIFSWSGSLLVKIWDGKQCVLNQHLFKVTSKYFPKWFYYYWTKYHLNKFIAIAETKATTMGHIKRADLSSSMVLVPDSESLKLMDCNISPFLNKLISNNSQIFGLEKLRDTLLPKLMSGEIRVQYDNKDKSV